MTVAICPQCAVERADYEGVDQHLAQCPNCGSPKDPMVELMGPHVNLTVVAARKTGHWIIRGWGLFRKPNDLRADVERIVGIMDLSITWTTYTYPLPAYLVHGDRFVGGELKGVEWTTGIYKFPCSNPDHEGDVFGGPIERIGDLSR